jgi:hypothetical protein
VYADDDWFHIFDYEVVQQAAGSETGANRTATVNVVFSSKSVLKNVLRQRDGVPADQLACCIDATFKLITEGWIISTIGYNTLYQDASGTTRNKFRPFLLSKGI